MAKIDFGGWINDASCFRVGLWYNYVFCDLARDRDELAFLKVVVGRFDDLCHTARIHRLVELVCWGIALDRRIPQSPAHVRICADVLVLRTQVIPLSLLIAMYEFGNIP